MRALIAAAVVFAVGCTDTAAGEPTVVEPGDAALFGQWVQPLVRDRCASLDCHGDAVRPMRLYALYGLRLDASLRGEMESPEELTENTLSIASVDPFADPESSLVLRKPLNEKAGGFEHEGRALFQTKDEAGYQCLLTWLSAGDSDALASACADFGE